MEYFLIITLLPFLYLIYKYPKIFIYVLLFQLVSQLSLLPKSYLFNERHILTIILFIFTFIKNKFKFNLIFDMREKINRYMFYFVSFVFISQIMFDGDDYYGKKSLIGLINSVLIYIIIINNFRSKEDLLKLSDSFILATFLSNIIYFVLKNHNSYNRLMTYYEPNYSSAAIVFLIPFILYNITQNRNKTFNILIFFSL